MLNENNYYTKHDSVRLSGNYTQVNNGLLEKSILSLEAVVVFSVIMSRLNLSKMNSICDKYGHLFVLLTNQQIQNICRCGHDKATKIMQELENLGLIYREKICGAADRIYPVKGIFVNASQDNTKRAHPSTRAVDISAADFDDEDDDCDDGTPF